MGLLLAYILGAISAAALIGFARRRARAGDPAITETLGELRGLLDGISGQQLRLTEQATLFAQLLGRPTERGSWGELQLRNVVEAAGLREHVDFEVQVHLASSDGAARPDMVLRLPGGGRVPVDSKATWESFQAALREPEHQRQRELLGKHAQDVRRQVQELGRKAYWAHFAVAPELVVLFMPSEAAFAAAVAADPDLLEFALRPPRRVAIASPTTLVALLSVVAVGWRQDALSANGEQIGRLGADLVRRLGVLSGLLTKSSRGLDSAVRAHNEVVAAVEGGLLQGARELGRLGVGGLDCGPAAPSLVAVRAPRAGQAEAVLR